MRIAIEGCTHGALDKIYETIEELDKKAGEKTDLLLCCGDFQATRDLADLKCMAAPDKYKEMCTFYKYYSGEKKAPFLTIFIGGNHEASNHLQELPYGGWVAPNIYYLGYAGVINVNGVRIGGLSGIFNGPHYLAGHHEIPPYDNGTTRSVYHVRNLETFRLKQLAKYPPDIMLSHDWPRGIHKFGDVEWLKSYKRFLVSDIDRDQLGSRPAMEVLETLKPKYWFSAHLHVKYPAIVRHEDGQKTKFLALDKCLPRRQYLVVLSVGEDVEEGSDIKISYDPHWLAILKSTNHLLSVSPGQNHMPGPLAKERHDFCPTDEEIVDIEKIFGNDLIIPDNFTKTVEPFDPSKESLRDLRTTEPPFVRFNPQNEDFCRRLGVDDPIELILAENPDLRGPPPSSVMPEEDMSSTSFPSFQEPDNEAEGNSSSFTIDVKPEPLAVESSTTESKGKVLKRRNQAIYATAEDD